MLFASYMINPVFKHQHKITFIFTPCLHACFKFFTNMIVLHTILHYTQSHVYASSIYINKCSLGDIRDVLQKQKKM